MIALNPSVRVIHYKVLMLTHSMNFFLHGSAYKILALHYLHPLLDWKLLEERLGVFLGYILQQILKFIVHSKVWKKNDQ